MGTKRKDAKKGARKDALVNGVEESPASTDSKGVNSAGSPLSQAAPLTEAATATEAPPENGKGKNGKATEAKAEVVVNAKAAPEKPADAAILTASKASLQADQAGGPTRGSPDLALVLSLINSAVLLALLATLGGAAWLAAHGRLETTLATYLVPLDAGGQGAQGLFALSARDIDGQHVHLSRYAGKLVVVANVASNDHARGYTVQNYERLNYIYDKYRSRGLEILAFPCNQFGGLEPGAEAEIKAVVRDTYNATFPLFSKVEVNGPGAHPVWKFLLQNQPQSHGYPAAIDWNFNKFVVSRLGWPIVRYPLTFDDEDLEGIEGWISANL